ncbi:calcium-binding protein [Jannaschia formosa]|uniref:calcium-binding protein n=1 Tax=Jannaschia formosa TaxID=2259592 RepID=UPI000E1BBBFA|nr:calcium-binding protein [Jannaschia formosa]TFL17102.1 hypothetical protein DR046_16315 [Jannaschia formosa]
MDPTDLTARLTSEADTVRGTEDADVVSAPPNNANFQGDDVLDLGAGIDTLIMERTGFLSLAAPRFAGTTGLDVIDMTAADEVRVTGGDALLAQSDDGTLRLVFGDAPMVLDLRGMSAPRAGYVLDGTGPVELEDTHQIVAVADGVAGDILGGERTDTILGGSGGDRLRGFLGNDLLRGNEGDDLIEGGDGHDDLHGGAGDDTISGGAGFDLIEGGGGADILSGGADADVFIVGIGSSITITDFDVADPYEQIDLAAFDGLRFGDMTISPFASGARLTIDDTTLLLEGVDPDELTGRSFAFAGQPTVSLAEALIAEADFSFTDAADTFQGGEGSQIFELSGRLGKLTAEDRFDGGPGIDTLRFDGEDRSMSIGRLEGMSGIEIVDLSGATGNHRFIVDPVMLERSSDGTLTLRHGTAPLSLDAVAPPDTVFVEGTGRVDLGSEEGQAVTISDAIGGHVVGSDYADIIAGGARADRIEGGLGHDTISGGGGEDTLIGGEDRDTFLLGGDGDVTVTGGGGFDTYVVSPGAGRITITDFDTTNYLERIDLSATSVRGRKDVDLSFSNGDVTLIADDFELVLKGAAGRTFGIDDFLVAGQRDDRFRIEADAPLSAVQPLLDEAPDGTVITFAAGTFDFTAPFVINRSNITVQGAGEGETVFVNRISDSDASNGQNNAFLVTPENVDEKLGVLARDAAEGDRSVALQAGHGLKVGDILFVTQPNDDAWLAETGNTGWDPQLGGQEDRTWLREFRSRIEAVDGNTVTLADPVTYDFAAGIAETRKSLMLSEVHLSDFTIQGRWGRADTYDFTNTRDAWANASALAFDSVTRSSLRDITILDMPSSGFRLQRSHEVVGENLTVDGSFNKGGSNGIHFEFNESFSNRLTGLESYGARHAIEFSASNAEHYNYIQADFIDRDINFHGSPDADNTILVNRMVMDYPAGVLPQWMAVSSGIFPKHPYPTIEENDVTFLHAETGERQDEITANDAGGYLSTGVGNDKLTGGAGNDTLVGGTEGDTLEGRGGSDRFVWTLYDGTDTILDFEAGRGGDVLVLRGTGFTDFDQLRVGRGEAGTALFLGGQGEIRLNGLEPSDLTRANVVLEAAEVRGLDEDAKAADKALMGSSADDRIGISRHHLEAADFSLAAGTGFDEVTLRVSSLLDPFHTTGRYTGVDAFDVSGLDRADLTVISSLVAQSDANELTLMVGDAGETVTLRAEGLGETQTLFLDGGRAIRLSDGAENAVTLTDRTGGNVTGGARADEITGGAANDVLRGGGGGDVLSGGAGLDRLTGGAGRDQFVFNVPGDAFQGVDQITDFTVGQDRIVLDIPNGLFPSGAMPAGAFSGTGEAQDRGDRVLYDPGNGHLSIDVDGNGSGNPLLIAILSGNPNLDASDIFLI